MSPELFTVGVYGCTAERFFQALRQVEIDTFCDLRARRGVRGREYAFANAVRLREELARCGIRYRHFPELAPAAETRAAQEDADRRAGTGKRRRAALAGAFIEEYERQRLARFESAAFVSGLGPDARRVVLFCVEREPAACHRGLLAGRLARDLGVTVRHLLP